MPDMQIRNNGRALTPVSRPHATFYYVQFLIVIRGLLDLFG